MRLLVLGPIVIASVVLASAMLTRGHDWGDDFAAYISQALSIVQGTERETVGHTAYSVQHSSRLPVPTAAPWGFPMLLAPWYVACGGLNILCLKAINVPFFALFLVAMFAFLVRRFSLLDSAIVVCVFAFSPVLLQFHDNVLSDITFLFFSTLAILLIDVVLVGPQKFAGSFAGNACVGLAMFLAFFVRTTGALLVPTALLTQAVLYQRNRPSHVNWSKTLPVALVPYVMFACLTVVLVATLPGGESSSLGSFKTVTFQTLSANVWAYLVLPSVFFWSLPLYDTFYGALLPFLIAGAVLHYKTDFHVLIYAALTLLLLVAWPYDEGLRYAFPILPFFVYFAYRGMQAIFVSVAEPHRQAGARLARALWIAIVISFVTTSARLAHATLLAQRAAGAGPFDAASTEMFEMIKTRTAATDVIIFDRPRAMRLMTARDSVRIDDCSQLARGNYAVIRRMAGSLDQVSADEITTCNQSVELDEVFENQQYSVYRVRRRRE
jgi:hypothetical protein